MSWPGTLNTKTTGQLVDANDWNDIINGVNFLGNTHDHSGDAGDGATLSALGTADYDSGWFSVSPGTNYTKAHGLASTPRLMVLMHSAVASPGSGDELVRVTQVDDNSSGDTADVLGADGTNIYVTTGDPNGLYEAVRSRRRKAASGYWRIQAWS